VEIDIATALTVANSAPSDPGSAMLSVDWGKMFQPLVDGCMQAIAKLIPVFLPIFGAIMLVEVLLYVFRLVSDRRDAAEEEFWEHVTDDGADAASELAFWSSYSDEELDPIYDELGAALDWEEG
jgi:hypothetical protein